MVGLIPKISCNMQNKHLTLALYVCTQASIHQSVCNALYCLQHTMRAGQKVLSQTTFHYTFGWKMLLAMAFY